MNENKTPPIVSKTGATISRATRSGANIDQCRPLDDSLFSDCFPDYHCAPDEEDKGSSAKTFVSDYTICLPDNECPDHSCCPEKAEQDCDPNV